MNRLSGSLMSEIFVADNAPRSAEKSKIFDLRKWNAHGNNAEKFRERFTPVNDYSFKVAAYGRKIVRHD